MAFTLDKHTNTLIFWFKGLRNKIKLSVHEKIFISFALFFGLLFVFLNPPLQAPDEGAHFYRAYQISSLIIIPSEYESNGKPFYGSSFPKSVTEAQIDLTAKIPGNVDEKFNLSQINNQIYKPLDTDERVVVNTSNTGLYSPVSYLPQAFGIAIGKIFDASPLALIWLGRAANLLVWILITLLALRIFPLSKIMFIILALNPMTLFLASSLSADPIAIASAFLLVSTVIATYQKRIAISARSIYLVLIVSTTVLALTKPVNILFGLLLFTIPTAFFGSMRKRILVSLSIVISAGLVYLLWNYQVKDFLEAAIQMQGYRQNQMSANAQILQLIANPFAYIIALINNFIFVVPGAHGSSIFQSFFGIFGWLDTFVPLWVIVGYILILFTAMLYQSGRNSITLTKKQKYIFGCVFLLIAVGNITAMYLNATPVGSTLIEGVQGRYFIPASILVIAIIASRKKIFTVSDAQMTKVVVWGMAIVFAMSISTLIYRYYVVIDTTLS